MALKGTIKDFGVADIFQLIGQQAKDGVLVLNNDVDEVRVYFKEGSVVRAENASRPEQMLLGTFMVRAEVITQQQLDTALKEQRRTLKRIGAILIDLGFVDQRTVTEFATLQMTETIYALFEWKQGTYQFEAIEVEPSPEGVQPIRSETVVMNGIRMTDEWPGIRERIPAYAWTVERMRPLPPPRRDAPRSDEFDLSDFGEFNMGQSEYDQIGPYERRVYDLIGGGRTVQNLIDLSRLGEFETCRAISTLMGEGYVRVIKPVDRSEESSIRIPKNLSAGRVALGFGRAIVSATLVVIAGLLVGQVGSAPAGAAVDGTLRYSPTIVHRHVSESQLRVLRRALEVYRLQTGRYPEALDDLVKSGVVSEHDIRFPYDRPYFYRVEADKPLLLPPIP